MFDHLAISVGDIERSRIFYAAALSPLGYGHVVDIAATPHSVRQIGFGSPSTPRFWISASGRGREPAHIAFCAAGRDDVSAFHAEALAAGGRDNGPPGRRPQYHASYFAAFVLDPDGNNVEAVCHVPGRFEDQFAG